MTPERWQHIDQLYHEALKLKTGERLAFVRESCGDDAILRQEVESLLEAHDRGGNFLSAAAGADPAPALQKQPTPSLLGRTLGHYQILSPLGEGGMGMVYRARDTRLGRLAAIKVLPREFASDPERKRRLIHEAKTTSALSHSHIVTVYEIDCLEGVDFIAMELVAGKTLDALIPRKGMRISEGLKIAIQVADALAAAHAAGIVHRDLKPSNVMVSEDGQVKLLDFGIAKLAQTSGIHDPHGQILTLSPESRPQTEEGVAVGTVAYMSPEQAEGKKVDTRSDVFSFGVVLYEMLTGTGPFQADSPLATMTAILREDPQPPRQRSPQIPVEVDRLILWCLRKDLTRRVQHMDDVKLALEDLQAEWGTGRQTALQSDVKNRRRWLWPAVLLAIVCAVGSVVWVLRSLPPSDEALAVTPLTSFPGIEHYPTFSPDGNQVAFTWDRGKPLEVDDNSYRNCDIYTLLLGSPTPLQLTNNSVEERSLVWSPDGRWIAFQRALGEDRLGIYMIPSIGGAEIELAEAQIPLGAVTMHSNLSWSPDGKWLAYPDRDSAQDSTGIFLISLETRQKRRLTSTQPAIQGDECPSFSPDGRSLAFARFASYNVSHLYVLPLTPAMEAAGQPRQITFGDLLSASPVWTPDGRQIIHVSGPKHHLGLWRLNLASPEKSKRLPLSSLAGTSKLVQPALSRDGRRLTFAQRHSDRNIWRVGLSSSGQQDSPPMQFIASTFLEFAPQYSSDGQKIAFLSYRSGTSEIWICDSSGSNLFQLTSHGGPEISRPHWSPDRKRIAYSAVSNGQDDVFSISAQGGKPQRITDHAAQDSAPSWSRDGRWIYFRSNRTGQFQVWKMAASGGDAVQVTKLGGADASETQDSRWLYYLKSEFDGSLWRVPTGGGQEQQVLDSVNATNFDVGGNGIYFMRNTTGKIPIEFFDFASLKRTSFATLDKVPAGFSVSPDKRWILYTQLDEAWSGDLMLVENFL